MAGRLEAAVAIALVGGCSSGTTASRIPVCTPSCPAGLSCNAGHCGPIACSSPAGCPSGLTCIAGFCASQSCAPACGAGQVCVDQVCVAAGGDDAGSLTCAPTYQACASANGDGYCAETLSDSSNCGGCGTACAAGEVCNGAGACEVACVAGEVACDNRCVSLATDRGNCGACAAACDSGQVCTAGACAATCAAPEVSCGASCADTTVDPANCGGCGQSCEADQLCVGGVCTVGCGGELVACGGVCTDTQFDDANCGACEVSCGASTVPQRCVRGACATCGGASELCCAGAICFGGLACTNEVCAGPTDAGFTTLALLAGQLGGFGTTDGTGATARFDNPEGLAYDGAGNLYVADYDSDLIRKIVLATGAVTTLAGSPNDPGSADGTGAAARFNAPYGLVYDGAGNLYVSDTGNDTLRQIVVATGVVTTLAGSPGAPGSANGTGAAARFSYPAGLAYDGAGTLYVADSNNYTIRQITVATGAVTNLAGTAGAVGSANGTGAAARFYNPIGLAYDGVANLYVTDSGNGTLRAIVLATGVVTTLAGTPGSPGSANGVGPAAQFDDPFGLAYDGASTLYVADLFSSTIRAVVVATRAVTTLAGSPKSPGSADGIGAAARFAAPGGVAYAGAGDLYVADTDNDTIRAVAVASGAVTTLAGLPPSAGSANGTGAAASFLSPQGLTDDGADSLYVADTFNDTLRAIAVATAAVTTIAGSAGDAGDVNNTGEASRFHTPFGVTSDGAGNLYVADTANNAIRKLVIATGTVTTLAGAPDAGSADGTGTAASFYSPEALACDDAGTLYVADTGNDTIRKIVLSTQVVTTLAGSAGSSGSTDGAGAAARFDNPEGLTWDGAGNLYLADTGNFTIRQIALATETVTTLAGLARAAGSADGAGAVARFNQPTGLACDGAGDLYVADTFNGTIRRLTLATGVVATAVGVAGQNGVQLGALNLARLNQPVGLAWASSPGRGPTLFVCDQIESAILEIH